MDEYADRYPGNEPGPQSTFFANPDAYPPRPMLIVPGDLVRHCCFDDGEVARWRVFAYKGRTEFCTVEVCPGHRDAVITRQASWI